MIRENCPFQNTNIKNRKTNNGHLASTQCNPQPKWTHRAFFPHVPKCAGTSVNLMIRESFPQMHSQSIDLHRSKLAAGSIGLDIMVSRNAVEALLDVPSPLIRLL